jgi:hypothetical protein
LAFAPLPAVRDTETERQGSTLNNHPGCTVVSLIARIVMPRLAAVSDLAYVKAGRQLAGA